MDGGAWKAAVHGVAEGQAGLSDFTFTFHCHALEKEMVTHSSILAWRIPGTVEPGGLPSMGLHRVRHDWSDLAAAAAGAPWAPSGFLFTLANRDLWQRSEREREETRAGVHVPLTSSLTSCLLLAPFLTKDPCFSQRSLLWKLLFSQILLLLCPLVPTSCVFFFFFSIPCPYLYLVNILCQTFLELFWIFHLSFWMI